MGYRYNNNGSGGGYNYVSDYGADPTGSRDSVAAINAAIADSVVNGKPVFFPKGVYLVNSTITIPAGMMLSGVGRSSEIRAGVAGISILKVASTSPSDSYGNRYGKIQDLYLNGNNLANVVGLDLSWVVVMGTYEHMQIENCAVGCRLDNTQNCTFTSVDCLKNGTGISLVNGAGNNKFTRCEYASSVNYNIFIGSDNTLPGYSTTQGQLPDVGYGNIPRGNNFDRCIAEYSTGTSLIYSVYIAIGSRNIFDSCDFQGGTTALVKIDTTGDTQALNRFNNCFFALSGTIPAVVHDGFRTILDHCHFEGGTNGATIIKYSNEIIVNECHIRNYIMQNMANDQRTNMKFTPMEKAALTVDRPNYGNMGAGWGILDMTLGKMIWWNGSNWIDATGTTV